MRKNLQKWNQESGIQRDNQCLMEIDAIVMNKLVSKVIALDYEQHFSRAKADVYYFDARFTRKYIGDYSRMIHFYRFNPLNFSKQYYKLMYNVNLKRREEEDDRLNQLIVQIIQQRRFSVESALNHRRVEPTHDVLSSILSRNVTNAVYSNLLNVFSDKATENRGSTKKTGADRDSNSKPRRIYKDTSFTITNPFADFKKASLSKICELRKNKLRSNHE